MVDIERIVDTIYPHSKPAFYSEKITRQSNGKAVITKNNQQHQNSLSS